MRHAAIARRGELAALRSENIRLKQAVAAWAAAALSLNDKLKALEGSA